MSQNIFDVYHCGKHPGYHPSGSFVYVLMLAEQLLSLSLCWFCKSTLLSQLHGPFYDHCPSAWGSLRYKCSPKSFTQVCMIFALFGNDHGELRFHHCTLVCWCNE